MHGSDRRLRLLTALITTTLCWALGAGSAAAFVYHSDFGFTGTGNGEFNFSSINHNGVAFEADGDVVLADPDNRRVQILSPTGTFRLAIVGTDLNPGNGYSAGEFGGPKDVAVHPTSGNIYVMDSTRQRVLVFEPDGDFVIEHGAGGTGDGAFQTATGIAMASDGSYYTSDYATHKIQKFSATGGFQYKYQTAPGAGAAALNQPFDVDVRGTDVWVADSGNSRIQHLTDTGTGFTHVKSVGSNGTGNGQIDTYQPFSVTAGPDGRVYASEYNAVEVFNASTGAWIRKISSCCVGSAMAPRGVGYRTHESGMFITDSGVDRVVRFVDQFPTADFTISPNPVAPNGTVTVTSTSTDPDGTVTVFEWDLDGDGQFDDATGPSATTSFVAQGPHSIGLRIYDDERAGAAIEKVVNVVPNQAPVVDFTPTPNPATTGQVISLVSTSSDPDGSIASIAWDLDDDGQFDDAATANTTKSFADDGTYDISVRATDNQGLPTVATHQVTVTNRPPVPSFTRSPVVPTAGVPVTLTSTSTDPDGTVQSIGWDFNNDSNFTDATGNQVQHFFASPGSVTMKMRAIDDDGDSAVATVTFTVNAQPAASFTTSPAAPLTGESLSFDSTSTDSDGTIASVAWDLDNDGQFDDGAGDPQTGSFATAGARAVHLEVIDNHGGRTTHSQIVDVTLNRAPTVSVGAAPASVSTGQEVTFTATGTDPDARALTYAWDLDNDGEFDDATGAVVKRTYTAAGTPGVKVRVTDSGGAAATAEATVAVIAPVAVLTPTAAPSATVPPAPVDVKPPTATVPLTPAQARVTDQQAVKGITVPLTCSEECRPQGFLLVKPSVAKKLKLKGLTPLDGQLVAGTAKTKLLGPNRHQLVLKLAPKVRKAFLASKLRSLAVVMRIELTDPAGNTSVVDRKITIRKSRKKR